MSTRPDVRFGVLGPVRMWHGGQRVPMGSPQQLTVLSVLLLRAGHPVSLDELTSAIWGDEPPRAATSTVRTYLSRLRRAIDGGPAMIETVGDGYALRVPPESVDVSRFHRSTAHARELLRDGDARGAVDVLEEALALWRGPALAGLPGRFATAQRARLEEGRLAADELRLAALLDAFPHQHPAVVPELTAMVDAYPLREGPRVLLMRALHGSGRPADALAVYREGRARLDADLGLEPGPALRRLHERILRGEAVVTAEPAPPVRQGAGPTHLPQDLVDFTGRDAELAAIGTGLLDGSGWVGIAGVDGIGRTAVAVRAAHLLRDRYVGGQLYADVRSSPDLADILAGWLLAFDVPRTELPTSVHARLALLHQVAAGRPLLIVLDNVDDAAPLEPLLRARPAGGLLMTGRRRLTNLSATWITIGGLRLDDSMVLLERIAGPERVASDRAAVRRLARLSAGWPLPLRLLAGRLRDRPMWSITAIADELDRELHNVTGVLHDECLAAEAPLVRAYHRLPPSQARALRMAGAIEQDEFSTHDMAAALALPYGAAFSAVDSLVDLGLLEQTAQPHHYRVHPIVRAFARRLAQTVEGTAGVTAARDRLSALRDGADLEAFETALAAST
ncbi:AfsR/SARP family transcriptional regulator [Asanoa siamensis]|uniref:OmpR/PhoB-type domain-containing protein n=1 Tax=Asanoa siamensis TaxID=926357 RepID=A0ABQ4CX78_9ACTN|nr:BTAD domain-containing putative transcriptional regulator [Asanoa siamensis]GIF75875.1 hypothetical protein Asi02nite_53930 [Asanoa siamensis]